MIAALGLFTFYASTGLPDKLDRRRSWAQARTDRFGALPVPQFAGPAEDAITVTGTLVPGVSGKYSSIDTLAGMADTGEAYPLVMRGKVWGFYTIESLDESHTNIMEDGFAKTIDFTLELMRAPDEATA